MSGFKVYQDLAERTNGEFYLGVCGPVRDVILGVKGIGPKKAEDIVKALTEAQKERS